MWLHCIAPHQRLGPCRVHDASGQDAPAAALGGRHGAALELEHGRERVPGSSEVNQRPDPATTTRRRSRRRRREGGETATKLKAQRVDIWTCSGRILGVHVRADKEPQAN